MLAPATISTSVNSDSNQDSDEEWDVDPDIDIIDKGVKGIQILIIVTKVEGHTGKERSHTQ